MSIDYETLWREAGVEGDDGGPDPETLDAAIDAIEGLQECGAIGSGDSAEDIAMALFNGDAVIAGDADSGAGILLTEIGAALRANDVSALGRVAASLGRRPPRRNPQPRPQPTTRIVTRRRTPPMPPRTRAVRVQVVNDGYDRALSKALANAGPGVGTPLTDMVVFGPFDIAAAGTQPLLTTTPRGFTLGALKVTGVIELGGGPPPVVAQQPAAQVLSLRAMLLGGQTFLGFTGDTPLGRFAPGSPDARVEDYEVPGGIVLSGSLVNVSAYPLKGVYVQFQGYPIEAGLLGRAHRI